MRGYQICQQLRRSEICADVIAADSHYSNAKNMKDSIIIVIRRAIS